MVSLFFYPSSLNEKQVHVVELSPELYEPISITGKLTEFCYEGFNRDLLPEIYEGFNRDLLPEIYEKHMAFISHCKLTSAVNFTASVIRTRKKDFLSESLNIQCSAPRRA